MIACSLLKKTERSPNTATRQFKEEKVRPRTKYYQCHAMRRSNEHVRNVLMSAR